MSLPAEYRTSTITDADGRERVVIHAYAADGAHVADIVFKGRDELPDYSLLHGSGPVMHLGEVPRMLTLSASDPRRSPEVRTIMGEECLRDYDTWCARFGAGGGVPHYVVDATPVGLAALAGTLSGDTRWSVLADEMRAGIWSSRALKLSDALVAAANVEPGMEAVIAGVRDRYVAHDAHQWELARICIDRLVGDQRTPEYLALEQDAPAWFTRTEFQVSEVERAGLAPELRAYWSRRIAALHAGGALSTVMQEIWAAHGTDHGLPGSVERALQQVLFVARDRLGSPATRDDGMTDLTWFEDTTLTQWFRSTNDPQRILAVARALAGDEVAAVEMQALLAGLEAHDALLSMLRERRIEHGRFMLSLTDQAAAAREPMTVEDLVVVHATSYEPERAADGSVRLQTRFDTMGYPRASLHFSLNHIVTDHMYGSWNGAGYVVVAPLAPAIERNGAPASLYGVDTWWERNPGAAVELPGAVVLRLDPTAAELITRVGDEVVVKSAGFTEADVAALTTAGVLDVAAVDRQVEDAIRWGSDPTFDPEALRTSLIATAARDAAAREVMAGFGVAPTAGGMWETGIDDKIMPLSLDLGATFTAHINTPSIQAEETANRILSDADQRAGGSLAEAGPEARRVAAAAGTLAPQAHRVVQRDMPNPGRMLPG